MSGNLQLLTGTLARAKQENRAALITCMTAGFPAVSEGIAAIQAMLNSGAGIVEAGLPHSDPVLDGPVIQAAGGIALRGGVRIADVIRTVREAYQAAGKPPGDLESPLPLGDVSLGELAAESLSCHRDLSHFAPGRGAIRPTGRGSDWAVGRAG